MRTFPIVKVFVLFIIFGLFVSCEREEEDKSQEAENSSVQSEPPAGEIIPDQYIITFDDDETAARISQMTFSDRASKARFSESRLNDVKARVNDLIQTSGIQVDSIKDYYAVAIAGFSAKLSDAEVQTLQQEPGLSIEPDRMMYLDNFQVESVDTSAAIARTAASQTVPCGIKKAGGYADGTQKGTWVWIVDTGIDLDHPDLNVITESTYAKSFVKGSPDDCNGHGTHVAGIIAAKNNNKGSVGVSAGAPVVPVKVFKCSGGSPVSTILAGIDHVARYDLVGDVMNLSLSGFYGSNCSSSSSYKKAVNNVAYGGTWVALAAGNEHDNANLYQPACLGGKKIYTVASITCDGKWSDFSNYGTTVDWVATGSDVYSTYKNGGYATLSGTSMATPHVAGILHQRAASPKERGTIKYKGRTYSIASRK